MAETEQTKVCPLCAETIKAAAKVCPYCRKSQGRWLFLSTNDLVAISSLVFLVGSAILVMIFLNVAHGRKFYPEAGRIEVLNSQLALEKNRYSSNSTNVVVFGVLSNSSPYAWRIGRMEIRFFNQEGKTVDSDDLFFDNFTIMPHSDHSFRSTVDKKHSDPQIINYKVHVSYAYDPNAWSP